MDQNAFSEVFDLGIFAWYVSFSSARMLSRIIRPTSSLLRVFTSRTVIFHNRKEEA
jgi:hypothetical protein